MCVSERLCGCVCVCVCVRWVHSVSFMTTYTITIGNRSLLADLRVVPGLDWVRKIQMGTSSGWMIPTWLQGKADDSFQQHLFSSLCDSDTSTLVNFLFLVVLSWVRNKTHLDAPAKDCVEWGTSLSEGPCDQLQHWVCERVIDLDHLEAELNEAGP